MRSKSGYYLLVLLGFVLNCSDKSVSPEQYGLQGSWRLYEEGGSPGFGYFVTPVPAEPVQSLTFTNRGQILSKGERFNSFDQVVHYRIDSTSVGPRLTLSPEPDGKPFLIGSFKIRGDTLRINPLCYEGCHYGLVRIR